LFQTDQPDALLLERFVTARDESAFELLMLRHGAMVLGLCRGMLRHAHDAEDAFQATFLALVRKAGSIGKRESLGSWLHKVAYRVALGARTSAAKRAGRNGRSLTTSRSRRRARMMTCGRCSTTSLADCPTS